MSCCRYKCLTGVGIARLENMLKDDEAIDPEVMTDEIRGCPKPMKVGTREVLSRE